MAVHLDGHGQNRALGAGFPVQGAIEGRSGFAHSDGGQVVMVNWDPRASMWAQACELLERAERLQRQFFRPHEAATRMPVWEPPVDMIESDQELLVLVALPGADSASTELLIDRGVLVVGAERPLPLTSGVRQVHRLEIPHGRFERRIPLPRRDYELSQWHLANGCLTVVLRRLR